MAFKLFNSSVRLDINKYFKFLYNDFEKGIVEIYRTEVFTNVQIKITVKPGQPRRKKMGKKQKNNKQLRNNKVRINNKQTKN